MPVWSDKLLAEVIRMILDAYFDIQFSTHSHGFRTGRGCHTALRDIYHTWGGTTWIIEGDIADCFGSLSHELLIAAPSRENPRWTLPAPHEKGTRCRICGRTGNSTRREVSSHKAQSSAQCSVTSCSTNWTGSSKPCSFPATPQEKAQRGIYSLDEPSTETLQERAEGGCPTLAKTSTATPCLPHL